MNPHSSVPVDKAIRQLQSRPLRDLAWSLLAPPVFSIIPEFADDCLTRDYVDDNLWPWLKSIDAQPMEFLGYMNRQRSPRLGIYFEQLLGFYFEYYGQDDNNEDQSRRFHLLAKNAQVSDGIRTLGEFDFIVEDKKTAAVYHIEAALKFYLGYIHRPNGIQGNTPCHNWHHWVGVNSKDTLAIKMQHLKNRQIQLNQTTEGRQIFKELGVNADSVKQRLFYTGRFYFPWQKNLKQPDYANKLPEQHHWLEARHFLADRRLITSTNHYCILPRNYWLSPLVITDFESDELILLNERELYEIIKQEFASGRTEWQVVEVNQDKTIVREYRRFFIISGRK